MDVRQAPRYVIRTAEQEASKNEGLKTTREIIAEQSRIVSDWKPWSDVWPLKIGRGILISLSATTGIYINHRFRARLKLRQFGWFPTMLGLSFVPSLVTALCHTEFIVNKVIMLEIPCAFCMETKSALLQMCGGLFTPLILAPIANFSITVGTSVYNVPHITDVRKIFGTVVSVYRPLMPKIAMILTFHALVAGFITYLEIRSFLRILDLQYLIKEEKEQKFKLNNVL